MVRRIVDVSVWYERNGFDIVTRGLNREALARLAGEGRTRFGLDTELRKYFDFK
jgi:murein DD-endopeptidase